ncbi:MAG TPA: hypothetical protein VMR75_01290, partial [Candidatus Saccharimonadales bacterium]|nr:hypothetical protein [Candidatus Saccharimonadales bacterium]
MAARGPEGEGAGAAVHNGSEANDPGYAALGSEEQDEQGLHPSENRRKYPVSPGDLARAQQHIEAARGNVKALRTLGQELIDEGILKLREEDEASSGTPKYVVEPGIPQAQPVLDKYQELIGELSEPPPIPPSEAPTEVMPPREPIPEAPPPSPEPVSPPEAVSPPPESSPPKPKPKPKPEPKSGEPQLEFHAANVDREARARALQSAEQQLQREAAASKGVKGVINRIWKGVFAHEYYRQKFASEHEAEMRASDNQLVHEGGSREAYYRANEALIGRLVESRINPEMETHQDEKVERMGNSEGEQALQSGVKDLIGRYARGQLNSESLREERTRLLEGLREQYPAILDGAHMVADNLISVAEQAKAMADNDIVLDRLLDGMRFYADEARGGVRTEVHRSAADKLVEAAQKSRLGRFAN